MAAGKGTEDVSWYNRTELIFCGIENIHVMRASFAMYCDALMSSDSSDSDCLGKIIASGWIGHCSKVLAAGVLAAEKLHLECSSVLVHCSDGWDRTAQITSIAQIILDPFYRTFEGLFTLIEKEWVLFGHKFHSRCGHADNHTKYPDERSPIFFQFLDVLHNVIMQFDNCFEYNTLLLVFVADHIHSGLFGNFLGNSEKQRTEQLKLRSTTVSIWSYVLCHKSRYTNLNYIPFPHPIWPSSSPKCLHIWRRYFNRWDPSAHPNSLRQEEWHDDW
jgi:hypothetical protein